MCVTPLWRCAYASPGQQYAQDVTHFVFFVFVLSRLMPRLEFQEKIKSKHDIQ